MRTIDTAKAERALLDPSYIDTNIELIADTIDYVIEHSIDDPDDRKKDDMELIYCLRDLKESFQLIKESRHE